ncbi:MAG TPA: hypothetical protein VFO49_03865 [Nocardioides sp.]|nr:hypothetical protein [Nocardioides sp.]
MNDIDRRLHQLGATIRTPHVPLEDDLARGHRRLGLHRWLVTGGTVAGVTVIALGVALAGDVLDDGPSSAPPASAPSSAPAPDVPSPKPSEPPAPEDQRTGAELLRDYRDVIAEHIDPDGSHLQKKPDNLQSGGGLGTKLGWSVPGQDGLGMVEVFVGNGWNSFTGADCDYGAQCRTERVDGITAEVVEWNGATTVVVRRDDGPVAITVDALFGNNSLVPVEGMEIPIDDLVRAAGDERLTPATPEQIRNAGTSMGFPDFDLPRPGAEGASADPVPQGR